MNWQPVESSQIEALGYDPEVEYPLGVKFPPTKKQKAESLPGSAYEYANVSPELFNMFINAKTNPEYDNSIGVFFHRVIKAHPELYPYRRIGG